MKNISDKIIVYSGIILEIIILTIAIFALNSDIKSASDVIQAISAIVNLIIVIVFFIISDISRSKEIKNNNKQYWFKNYVVSEFLPIFDSLFESSKGKIMEITNNTYKDDLDKETEFEKCLSEFSNRLQEIVQGSYLKIGVISDELSKKIQLEMQDFEDEYSKKLEIIIFLVGQTRAEAIKEIIQFILNKQAKIFKILYEYGKEIDFM